MTFFDLGPDAKWSHIALGGYNFEHGCGQWNTPVEVWWHVPEDVYAEDLLTGLIGELDHAVKATQEADDADLAESLRADLADAVSVVSGGAAENQVIRGSETEPGIYRAGDDLIAWAYGADGETTITERLTYRNVKRPSSVGVFDPQSGESGWWNPLGYFADELAQEL